MCFFLENFDANQLGSVGTLGEKQAQRCSMCGAGAAAVLLLACRALNLQCRQLQYLVNTEAAGASDFLSLLDPKPTEMCYCKS